MMTPYYQEKNITIYHGDCLEILSQLEDKSIDFVFADPPYGINKAEWDKEYPKGFEKEILRVSRGGAVITCGEQNLHTCIQELGNEYRGLFYGWNLNGMTHSPIGFMNVLIAVCAGDIKYGGQNFCRFTIKNIGILNHPSPKPLQYLKCIIQRFTEEGDIILDPFMGSGTTLVAAKNLGRRAIGIELEGKYCKIAVERLRQEILV